jgi:hypothetical protein
MNQTLDPFAMGGILSLVRSTGAGRCPPVLPTPGNAGRRELFRHPIAANLSLIHLVKNNC